MIESRMVEAYERKKGPARDYTNIGVVSEPAFAYLPDPKTVFAVRANRFAALQADNPLGPYLGFLSRLAFVQHEAQASVPLPIPAVEAEPSLHRPQAMPLSKEILSEDDHFTQLVAWFIQHAVVPGAPEPAKQARARLHAMVWPERLALAEAILDGTYPVEQLGESLYMAAALQVYMTQRAARLDTTRLRPIGRGGCPACGSGPVASMIVGWAGAERARYCCCSICATLWNYVRIKCTTCNATGGISYYLIEEQSKEIAVETCTVCGNYIKHLHQHRNAAIEPFADDLASFGLDLLVREKGFRRAAANPLMVVL